MVERIGLRLGLTTLKCQRLDDLVEATTLPKSSLCTYCWDGCGGGAGAGRTGRTYSAMTTRKPRSQVVYSGAYFRRMEERQNPG
jgi:hypothetical protein